MQLISDTKCVALANLNIVASSHQLSEEGICEALIETIGTHLLRAGFLLVSANYEMPNAECRWEFDRLHNNQMYLIRSMILRLRAANHKTDIRVMLTALGQLSDQPLRRIDISLLENPMLSMADIMSFRDGAIPVVHQPRLANSPADLDTLKEWVVSKERRLPIILLTEIDIHGGAARDDVYSIDPHILASNTFGMAHIVMMPNRATHHWSILVGKDWGAYMGGIRTYHPNLDFNVDNPRKHQLATWKAIQRWHFQELTGRAAFAKFMARQIQHHSFVDWTRKAGHGYRIKGVCE